MNANNEVETLDSSAEVEDEGKTDSNVPSSPQSSGQSLTEEELIAAVQKQLEYYFSKENLQQDSFLMSHMDSNMSAPMNIVMKFSKLKALTQDEEMVIKALEKSSLTLIEGNRIKVGTKLVGRSTIILREIPTDSPEGEVKEIFKYESCKPIVSMRSDIGDTWFVTFESEDDAKDTLIDLRLKKRTFRDQPVKGRMKTETIVRSFYPVQQQQPQQQSSVVYPNMGFPIVGTNIMAAAMYGFTPVMPGQILPVMGIPVHSMNGNTPIDPNILASSLAYIDPLVASLDSAQALPTPTPANTPTSASFTKQSQAKAAVKPGSSGASGFHMNGHHSTNLKDAINTNGFARKENRYKHIGINGTSPANVSGKGLSTSGAGTGAVSTGAGINPRKPRTLPRKNDTQQATATITTSTVAAAPTPTSNPPMIEISGDDFPPLGATADDDTIPTFGYKYSFKKYSMDEIVDIVRNIDVATLPDSVKPEDHPLAMTDTAHADLLKKQRSHSIEETREQLRQGKPVQRDAVASGAVDFGAMIYGDGYDASSASLDTSVPEQTTNIPFSKGLNSWAAMVKSSGAVYETVPSNKSTPTSTSSSSKPSPSNGASSAVAVTSSSTARNKSSNATLNGSKSGAKQASTNEYNPIDSLTPRSHPDSNSSHIEPELVFTSSSVESEADFYATPQSNHYGGKSASSNDIHETLPSAKRIVEAEITVNHSPINGLGPTHAVALAETLLPKPSTQSAQSAPAAGSWGGKPTFANILKLKQAEAATNDLPEATKSSVNSSSYTTTVSTGAKSSRRSVSAPVSPDNSARSTNHIRPSESQTQSFTGLTQNNREKKASDDITGSQRSHGYGTISKKLYDNSGNHNLENSSSVHDVSWRIHASKLSESKESSL